MDERVYLKKRRVPRRGLLRKVGILAKGQYIFGMSFEVGEGGMLLSSEVPLEEGQRIVISFHIPEMTHIVTRALLRYTTEIIYEGQPMLVYGLQFETINFAAKRKIRNYVALKQKGEKAVYKIASAA